MSAIEVDTTRLPLLLHDLRLPAIARLWPDFVERADKEGWPAARLLAAGRDEDLGVRWRLVDGDDRPITLDLDALERG